MKPRPENAAGTGSATGSIPRLTCPHCAVAVTPRVFRFGPHLHAVCPRCGCYIKFVPKVTMWLEMVGDPPLGPLFEKVR